MRLRTLNLRFLARGLGIAALWLIIGSVLAQERIQPSSEVESPVTIVTTAYDHAIALDGIDTSNLISGRLTVVGPDGTVAYKEQGQWDAMIWAPAAHMQNGWYKWESIFIVASSTTTASEGWDRELIKRSGRLYVKDGLIQPQDRPQFEQGSKSMSPAFDNSVEAPIGSVLNSAEPEPWPKRAPSTLGESQSSRIHEGKVFNQEVEVELEVPQFILDDTDVTSENLVDAEWFISANGSPSILAFLGSQAPIGANLNRVLELHAQAPSGSLTLKRSGGLCTSSNGSCDTSSQGGTDLSIRSDAPALEWFDTDDPEQQNWGLFTNNDQWRLRDRNAFTNPLLIEAGAIDNAIFVSDDKVGFGTSTPEAHVHVTGIVPDIRLDDGGTEMVQLALELNDFSIDNDAAGGDSIFEISMDAPIGSFEINSSGDVGMGTTFPGSALHVFRSDGTAGIVVEETQSIATNTMFEMRHNGNPGFLMKNTDSGAGWEFRLGGSGNTEQFTINKTSVSGPELSLLASGDLRIKGNFVSASRTFISASSRAAKQDIVEIDERNILDRVAQMPIYEWSYKSAPASRHIGPMAEEYHEEFGLAGGGKGLAGTDMAGLSLASIKALHAQLRELKEQNIALQERLQNLEDYRARHIVSDTLESDPVARH